MAKREFVLLAHTYKPAKHHLCGWMLSEKLDGIRAWWDGGVTRGLPKTEVPWANNNKDARYVIPPVATGLWSRLGNVIHAPNWFLDQLPPLSLDGELYAGRGNFQLATSITSCIVPDDRWKLLTYCVFDSPRIPTILADGFIDNKPNFVKMLKGCVPWYMERAETITPPESTLDYERMYKWLGRTLVPQPNVRLLEQEQLPFSTAATLARVDARLSEILELGGEGVVLRSHVSRWMPERSHYLLKNKPFSDDEAVVTGYVWGRETDRGSKLLGLMGALVTNYKGKRFELSGFKNEERVMKFLGDGDFEEGYKYAGTDVSGAWHNPRYPIGSVVTFKYRELTDDGIPKEGRYLRKRVIR